MLRVSKSAQRFLNEQFCKYLKNKSGPLIFFIGEIKIKTMVEHLKFC